MFKGKKRGQPAIGTLIGADSRVQGDIEFKGGLHIDGHVQGNVISADAERGFLSISERGSVEGVVAAPRVRLNGTVNGDVKATERVELGPRAKVIGNVQYKLIEMAVGAEVNGKLIHESERRAEAVDEYDEHEPVGSVHLVGE